MDAIMDMLVWCGMALLVVAAVIGWGRLYVWFVAPARLHALPSDSLSANPYSSRDW